MQLRCGHQRCVLICKLFEVTRPQLKQSSELAWVDDDCCTGSLCIAVQKWGGRGGGTGTLELVVMSRSMLELLVPAFVDSRVGTKHLSAGASHAVSPVSTFQ